VNVYVIEYAAKLITTNLTTKFFNENFVKKKSRLFDGRDLNKSTFKKYMEFTTFFKKPPHVAGCRAEKLNFNLN
jgi:hypothetical protein